MNSIHILHLIMLINYIRGGLPPPERSYKILMLLPMASESHRNVFMPLVEALASRGHKIEMLTSYNNHHQNPNIREIAHNLSYYPEPNLNMFEVRKKGGALHRFLYHLPRVARDLYHLPHVRKLYENRKEYDLIVIDRAFSEPVYPFLMEMPFITVATHGTEPRQSAVLGNPISPAYFPNDFFTVDVQSFVDRLVNIFFQVYFAFYWRKWRIVPDVQKEISLQFPSLPPLLEIERNQSLALLNSHFSMDMAFPLLPNQVEVGGMHCRPAHPLPERLMSWIEGARAGVVYFSLGTITRGETMPVNYRNMFLEAFRKLDQRIIWKFEREMEGILDNIMISQWLPQQDILAHPNVKVFITHGGMLSLQEACYHQTPVLVLPITADQPRNGATVRKNGWGSVLNWEELTVDLIVSSVKELIRNCTYEENMKAVSRLFKDQLNSPVDRAVFWTEYVIRHRGAPEELRSPAAKLSWVEYLLLDVLGLLLLTAIAISFLARWVLKKVLWIMFRFSIKRKTE